MSRPVCWLLVLACLVVPRAVHAGDLPRFEFRDGDRVVLIERDQKYGYLETFLTAENPAKTITYRNLGWSGDTVFGQARAGFGSPADGFARLKEHVLAQPPTVILVGYGMAESFDGEAGLPRFVEGYNRLLDTLAPTRARLILLSPIAHEDLGRPLPDPTQHNKDLKLYRDAIERVAKERGARFVDLFTPTLGSEVSTDDGIHLNRIGSWFLAERVYSALSHDPGSGTYQWLIEIDSEGGIARTEGVRVAKVEARSNGLRFETTDATLAPPDVSEPLRGQSIGVGFDRVLRVKGLAPGRYVLKVDGRPVETKSAESWAKGVKLSGRPEDDQAERLRQVINEKNRLYFYRWRPQNETYLFGFRKHEQGNNAREIPLFDPLVAEKEKEIASLRVPVSHIYELTRENEAAK